MFCTDYYYLNGDGGCEMVAAADARIQTLDMVFNGLERCCPGLFSRFFYSIRTTNMGIIIKQKAGNILDDIAMAGCKLFSVECAIMTTNARRRWRWGSSAQHYEGMRFVNGKLHIF